jgi:hypothetical protein
MAQAASTTIGARQQCRFVVRNKHILAAFEMLPILLLSGIKIDRGKRLLPDRVQSMNCNGAWKYSKTSSPARSGH